MGRADGREEFPELSRFARLAAAAGRGFVRCFQAAADFAVPDRCQLCGRVRRSDGWAAGGLAAPAACMDRTIRVSVLGGLVVENRPFCRDCLGRLLPAAAPGRVGVYAPSGFVTTDAGASFGRRPMNGGTDALDASTRLPLLAVSPFITTAESLQIVHLIKFHGRSSLVVPAAAAMAHALVSQPGVFRVGEEGVLLVPVPMHPRARRRRGFNQAELLAGAVSRVTGAAVDRKALRKCSQNRPQSLVAAPDRAENVRGVFSCVEGSLRGRRVILVDDLVTTGATVAACAHAALSAGAVLVASLSLARAL